MAIEENISGCALSKLYAKKNDVLERPVEDSPSTDESDHDQDSGTETSELDDDGWV